MVLARRQQLAPLLNSQGELVGELLHRVPEPVLRGGRREAQQLFDHATSTLTTRIAEIASGQVLLLDEFVLTPWDPDDAQYDAVGFFEADLLGGSQPNLSVWDNVKVIPEPTTPPMLVAGTLTLLTLARARRPVGG